MTSKNRSPFAFRSALTAGGIFLLLAVLALAVPSFFDTLTGAALTTTTTTAHASEAAQPVPFAQNWSNVSLISANDDWSAVPGIVGYRGDNLTAATGADPQTITADGSATPVNVWANQTAPDTFLSGGVAEFEIADPVIALNGSGTADVPHIVINLNTAGATAVNVAYNLRDLDASTDNAVQPVALQYRVGNAGNYINIPAAFVADATTGPSQATLVTPVSVQLPAAALNQPLVQLRILTTNAVGNDEWVGIDDINITGSGGGPVNLSGFGAANPSTITAGGSTLLTVVVTPANTPPSTNIAVTGNLTSIGGAAQQLFFDNGTNGDVTAGDNVFSYAAAIPNDQASGGRSLPITITDAESRTATTVITLTVSAPQNAAVHLTMGNPSNAVTDVNQPFNYLLVKQQYVMSYHRDRAIPNWVSWHLDSSWLGSTPRQDDFRNDPSLPAGWFQAQSNSYSGSGFDRGHHTPSGDRTASVADNSATFFMTNMMPQAPANNQGPWEELESYCRTLVGQGSELYIIAGGQGQGGVGSAGAATTIAGGAITVPAVTWKVIIVLPSGTDDVNRVTKTTRTIAVIMPNRQDIGINTPWRNFRTSVRQVERLTGYNFFSNVRPNVRRLIKQRVDAQ